MTKEELMRKQYEGVLDRFFELMSDRKVRRVLLHLYKYRRNKDEKRRSLLAVRGLLMREFNVSDAEWQVIIDALAKSPFRDQYLRFDGRNNLRFYALSELGERLVGAVFKQCVRYDDDL